jgi:hypothetical protein
MLNLKISKFDFRGVTGIIICYPTLHLNPPAILLVSPQLAIEYLLNVPIVGSRLNSLNELIAYPYVKHITGYPDSPDIL